jgi:Tfp pilus assembly protein PilF
VRFAQMRLARELDPLSLVVNNTLGRAYRDAHHYEEAVQQCQDTLKLDPNFSMGHWCLAQAYTGKKQFTVVVAELKHARQLGTTPLLISDLGCAYASSGNKAAARAVLNGLKYQARSHYVSPYLIASIYSTLGEKDEAFKWLRKAYSQRDRITDLPLGPAMDPLRSDPRFISLIKQLKLPPS